MMILQKIPKQIFFSKTNLMASQKVEKVKKTQL